MSLIAYYGYQLNPTIENYGITQNMIWEILGDTLLTTAIPNYFSRKAEILKQVEAHKILPSFTGKDITLNIGDSVTLTDTNNVLSNYINQVANTTNLTVDKSGSSIFIS